MSELDDIATYFCSMAAHTPSYPPPAIMVIGHEADAIGAADGYGDDAIENLTWLAGYLSYPVDGVYLSACLPVDALDQASLPPDNVILPDHPELRHGWLAWAHSITTRESVSVMAVRHVDDYGQPEWQMVKPDETTDETFAPLAAAVGEYIRMPSMPDERRRRRVAFDLVRRDNGTGHLVTTYEAGTLLKSVDAYTEAMR